LIKNGGIRVNELCKGTTVHSLTWDQPTPLDITVVGA
jgi:hypothetical protein